MGDNEVAKKGRIRAFSIVSITIIVLFLIVHSLYPSVFLYMPVVCIGINLGVLSMISTYTHRSSKDLLISVDLPSLVFKLIILNVLSCTFLMMLRSAPDVHVAVLWGIPLMTTYFMIPIGLANLMMLFPKKIFSDSRRKSILLVFAFIFFFFFEFSYIYNVFTGNYDSSLVKRGGIFGEIAVFESVLGWMSRIVIIPFVSLIFLSAILSAMQLFRLRNMTARRTYYSMLIPYVMAMIIMPIVIIVHIFFGLCDILLYPLEASIFAPMVSYYLIRIYMILQHMGDLKPGEEPLSLMEIYVTENDDDSGAKNALLKQLRAGKSAVVFSYESPSDFFRGWEKDLLKSVFYVQILDDGYMVEGTKFHTIDSLSKMRPSKTDLRGVVVYMHAFPVTTTHSFDSRERSRLYQTVRDMLKEGALLISPVDKSYVCCSDENLIHTKYPAWHVKPLMVLRMEEYINELYSKIRPEGKERFISAISALTREGLPKITKLDSYISLDMHAEMTPNRFIKLFERIKKIVVAEHLFTEEEYEEILRSLFRRYSEDYDSMVKIKKGTVHFISGENIEKRLTDMLYFLSERGKKIFVISRKNPDILKDEIHPSANVEIRWLTNVQESKTAISPHLESIKKEVFDFLDRNPDGVVVLDGMEYLIRIHGFSSILELLWILKDRIASTGASMLIPLDTRVLSEADAAILKREFRFL